MKKLIALLAVLLLAATAALADTGTVFETVGGYEWTFSSGAGGWSTDMRILADGSFSGEYHDSEMGDTGDAYPDGTVYFRSFSGQMSVVEQMDDKTWKIRVNRLEAASAEEYIDEGVRYIPSDVYGISEGDEMILYAPGTPVSILSEDMQLWAHVIDQETPPSELEDWFLMSEKNDSGFVGYPRMTGIANPWKDLTAEELLAESGLSFGVPAGAENVIYRYLPEERLAEMQFTIDGEEYCARIQPAAEPRDISGMYFEWEKKEEVSIGDSTGTISQTQTGSGDWVELCQWFDHGLQYSLSVYTTEPDGLDLTAVAEQI